MTVTPVGASLTKVPETEAEIRLTRSEVRPGAGWDTRNGGERVSGTARRGTDATPERTIVEYRRVAEYRDVRGCEALPIYDALGIAGTYRGSPLAEIRKTENGVSISAHADDRFRTVTIGKQRTTVVTTDAKLGTQTTTVFENGQVSAYSQQWSPERGPVGPRTPVQPLTPDEVQAISKRALNAIDHPGCAAPIA
jgi:hypothetical protein